jgi:hypothetical protein
LRLPLLPADAAHAPAGTLKHTSLPALKESKDAAVIWPLLTLKSFEFTLHGGESVTVAGNGALKFTRESMGVTLLTITVATSIWLSVLSERPLISPVTAPRPLEKEKSKVTGAALACAHPRIKAKLEIAAKLADCK